MKRPFPTAPVIGSILYVLAMCAAVWFMSKVVEGLPEPERPTYLPE